MQALEVLVVDDEPTIVEIFSSVLERLGHHVTSARSGEEALELARRGRYDLVFLDIKLPGVSGIQVLRDLRGLDPSPAVVMITGLLDDDLYDVTMHSPRPANGFITKPCSFRSIEDCVRQVVREDSPYIHTPRDEFQYLGAKLQSSLEEAGRTLAIAEVLTSGSLAQTLGDAFRYDGGFVGGVSLHSAGSLGRLLGSPSVEPAELVTETTTRRLAEAVRASLEADLGVALAVMSDLYPHDTEVPLGTCHLAVADRDGTRAERRHFASERAKLRREAAYFALGELLAHVRGPSEPPRS